MADYNGWTNWETWNVALWIGNDEGLYNCQQEFIRHADEEITGNDVRQYVAELLPNGTPDMESGWATENPIDWDEIAEHWEDERLELEADA
jgi:hypothetical protein